MRELIEPINRLIRRDSVGSCSLPVRMPTGEPSAFQRLAERAGWPAGRNQCDGCRDGLALRGGLHVNAQGRAVQACTADRYEYTR